jgi:hypothetical protein
MLASLAALLCSTTNASEGEFINLPPTVKERPLAEKPLVKITGLGILYCTSNDKCDWSSTFRLGVVPVSIGIALESRPEAKDRVLDFSWEIRDMVTSQAVFQDYAEGKVDHVPFQRMRYQYSKMPAELTTLRKDGKYRLFISALSADGAVSSEMSYQLRIEEPSNTLTRKITGNEWGECVTIATGDDNGAEACSLTVIDSPSRNSSTAEAFSNLEKCLSSPRTATILGHANEGYMCTGDGNHCGKTNDSVMTPHNGVKWIPLAAGIKDKDSELMLAGCDVGAGEDGASLLFKLAQATHRNVRGPTGILHCSPKQKRMWIEGVWQVATPVIKPAPIQAPPHTVRFNKIGYFSLGAQKTRVDIENVQVNEMALYVDGKRIDAKNQFRLDDLDVLKLIDFSHPEISEDIILGTVTGELTIEIRQSGAGIIEKHFKILANSIAQDAENPTYFYRLDSRLHERLASAIYFLSR